MKGILANANTQNNRLLTQFRFSCNMYCVLQVFKKTMNSQLVVRIPEEQKLMLETLAYNSQSSISRVVRTALFDFIEKKTKTDKENLFVELAKVGKGKKVSGAPKNLSANYKKYLYKG
ncbi:MAG: hypothetical protein ABID04_00310 [Patescibacteria group bacterium]